MAFHDHQQRQQPQRSRPSIDTSLPLPSGPSAADYLQHHSPSAYADANLASPSIFSSPYQRANHPPSALNATASPPKTPTIPTEAPIPVGTSTSTSTSTTSTSGTTTAGTTNFLDAARAGTLPFPPPRTLSLPLAAGATALHQAAATGN